MAGWGCVWRERGQPRLASQDLGRNNRKPLTQQAAVWVPGCISPSHLLSLAAFLCLYRLF